MNFTINNALDVIENAISENPTHSIEEAQEAMQFLGTKSRFPADAKARLAAIIERYEAAVAEEGAGRTMEEKLRKARKNYVVGVTEAGNKSLHNGDDLAYLLEGTSLEFVLELADELVPLEGQTHAERYADLNTGHRRMCAGNKLRSALKAGDLKITYRKNGTPKALVLNKKS